MPHFHDYGLIEGILLPLFNGTPAYLTSPFAFLKRPVCWLSAISKYGGTHTQAFDFAYRYCARRVTASEKAGLDLGSLRSAGNGGEPIHPATAEIFYSAFAACGLRRDVMAPVFGLAEATLLVTAKPPHEPLASVRAEGDRVLIGCGHALPETEIAVVDPETKERCASGQTGEIWVNAPGVADGYWGRPEESEATFRAKISGEGRSYLRTGDLGFLQGGQLYIIRGLNHAPQDIERTAEQSHPTLRPDNCAAFRYQRGWGRAVVRGARGGTCPVQRSAARRDLCGDPRSRGGAAWDLGIWRSSDPAGVDQ
jgi:acyl-CoA synthetase (AMP-forming)/AMP-acid ligase II